MSPDMHWRTREERNDEEHKEKASFVMLFIHVGKRLKSRSQMLSRKVFLKISQHSQENTGVGVSF